MRKQFYCISIIITALFLFGFRAGDEIGDPEEKKLSEPNTPVLAYEETIAPQKSNQELYKQYHLLAVSSLDEALSAFAGNQLWTYRMVHNAYNYIKLLNGLMIEGSDNDFSVILDQIKTILPELKAKNISKTQEMQIKTELKKINKKLEQDYTWEKVNTWIKE